MTSLAVRVPDDKNFQKGHTLQLIVPDVQGFNENIAHNLDGHRTSMIEKL